MAGNYYNFYAATAGSGNPSLSNGNATDSICPYGWQLAENDGDKSFSNLTNTYLSFSTTHASGEYPSPELSSDITLLSFLRSGYYTYSNGALNSQRTRGRYWSLRSGSGAYANDLYFNSTNIGPQNSSPRGSGFILRCLAR